MKLHYRDGGRNDTINTYETITDTTSQHSDAIHKRYDKKINNTLLDETMNKQSSTKYRDVWPLASRKHANFKRRSYYKVLATSNLL